MHNAMGSSGIHPGLAWKGVLATAWAGSVVRAGGRE